MEKLKIRKSGLKKFEMKERSEDGVHGSLSRGRSVALFLEPKYD